MRGDDRARHAARVPRVHRRADARRRAARAHRRRGLRVLRTADQGPAGAARAQQAGHRRDRRGPGRGAGAALRRAQLPAGGQGARRDDGGGDRRGDARVDPHARVDGRRDPSARRGQARRDPGQDRLPRPLARLVRARARAHHLRGQPARGDALRARSPAREADRAGRSRRVGDAGPHRQRLLPPVAQRDRRPRRDPAAAAVRRRRRRRRQLRRHRHGHRARDHARVRRSGPALRRRRGAARVVDDGRRRALQRRWPSGSSRSSTPTPCSTASPSTGA